MNDAPVDENPAPESPPRVPPAPPDTGPTETSKPIGDAIASPVEPGLNEPLPATRKPPSDEEHLDEQADDDAHKDALGDTEPPPACRRRALPISPSGFARKCRSARDRRFADRLQDWRIAGGSQPPLHIQSDALH
jgi:hypothetical protein